MHPMAKKDNMDTTMQDKMSQHDVKVLANAAHAHLDAIAELVRHQVSASGRVRTKKGDTKEKKPKDLPETGLVRTLFAPLGSGKSMAAGRLTFELALLPDGEEEKLHTEAGTDKDDPRGQEGQPIITTTRAMRAAQTRARRTRRARWAVHALA
eukprot:CAMPEP_0204587512 /NCGR_PEP_ID=MMETSP0661-20131031/48098_1 /ASSEMBLY_ACC=CAM_ASM_000606 /TAXON_ID=109239 /ORGANISM="Alexandrium margalefi, Strain AMGDE01CS-322" /LENGTH=152 /DNA_ID=CAMNT_0051597241 /DNA_START=34 /DNA_END=488 /DNA_ORIENTATION=+